MRLVPKKNYCIIGSGNLSRHLSYYFKLKNINHTQLFRKSSKTTFQSCIREAQVVLLAISDSAIKPFIEENPSFLNKTLVHFSGSITVQKAHCAHPLMTFSNSLYDIETYENIPFIVSKGFDFKSIFPKLSNPFFSLEDKKRSYYHALCVLAGNLPQILWSEINHKMTQDLNLPPKIMESFLKQSLKNWLENTGKSLTGPFARKDWLTIQKNIDSLKDDSLREFYKETIHLIFKKTMSKQSALKKDNSLQVENQFQIEEFIQRQLQEHLQNPTTNPRQTK